MSENSAGTHFSYDKFLRSFVGLLMAPVAGGAIAMGGYALAAITRGFVTGTLPDDIFGAFIGSLTIGIMAGARVGIAPTLVIGWPLHLILLRTGFVHLATYIMFGAALSVGAVQFMTPAVTIAFDTDQKAAYAQRAKAYADAAEKGYFIGAAHLSFPGLGRLRAADGGAYVFVPANYRSAP